MRKKSVHLFISPILNESRLMKTCHSTIKLGLVDEITVLGIWQSGLPERQQLGDGISLIRVKTISRTRPTKKWLLRKIFALWSFVQYCRYSYRFCKDYLPGYISCHNLLLLPLSSYIKTKTGCRFFYEPHELETERTGMSRAEQKVARLIESRFIRRADTVITVCEPITKIYQEQYPLDDSKLLTIANSPVNPSYGKSAERHNVLREEFDIPQEAIVFIYQGVLDKYRGIQNYLDCFTRLDDRFHLVFMGYGEDEDLIRGYSARYRNIHFKPAVPVSEIIRYSSSADVGLFVIPGYNISLSYKYCLPNKFFEYAIGNLHICVSDNFSLLSALVKSDRLGTVISAEGDSLYQWISGISGKEDILPEKESQDLRKNYGWQNEEKKYIGIYS